MPNPRTSSCSHKIGDLLPGIWSKIQASCHNQGTLIGECWAQIVGSQFAKDSRVVGFDRGIITIKVANSSLYSLLAYYEKKRLLHKIKAQFPKVEVKDLVFRLG